MGCDSRQLTGHVVGLASLRCWGRFELTDAVGHADLKPRGRKTRAILAYLALHPDRAVSRQRLMGLLWGDRGEPQARSSMRQAIFELRGLCDRGLIEVSRDCVQLHGAYLETDLDRITAALAAGQCASADLPDPDEQLFDDLDGLGEAFDDWLIVERGRQRALLDQALAASPRAPLPRAAEAVEFVDRPSGRMWRARPLVLAAMLGIAAPLAAFMLRPDVPQSAAPQDELLDMAQAQIMSRKGDHLASAEALSRRAIAIAPRDARAWTLLAESMAIGETGGPRLAAAEQAARHAVALDPNAGLAHGVLGMALGFTSVEARGEIRKAAQLSPHDPQVLFWLSNLDGNEGAYQRQLERVRAVVARAPNWGLALAQATTLSLQMGYREEAQAYLARLLRIDVGACYALMFDGRHDHADYSAIVRQVKLMRTRGNANSATDRLFGFALLAVGDAGRARLLLALPDAEWRIANGEPPSLATLARYNRDGLRDELAETMLRNAVANAIAAGRAADLVRIYDSRQGVFAQLADPANFSDLAEYGINIAIALRTVGRTAEADALLARLDRDLQRRREIGPLPIPLIATGAQLAAVKGDTAGALTQLETAVAAGWRYAPDRISPDVAAVPAFAALRGQARFETLRARLIAERERHAAEIAKIV